MKKPLKTEPKATWPRITRYTHHLIVDGTTFEQLVKAKEFAVEVAQKRIPEIHTALASEVVHK